MKKWLAMILCFGIVFGAAGCGGTETAPEQEVKQESAQDQAQKNEDEETFEFTTDEFVAAVDERLTERERKLLSTYEVEKEDGKRMYKMSEDVSLMIQESEKSGKVEGMIFYETFNSLQGEALDDYTALLINSLIVVDPYDVQEIFETLKLDSTEEGIHFAKGSNGNYIYEVKGNVAKVTFLAAVTE